jgi:hypothetical protein
MEFTGEDLRDAGIEQVLLSEGHWRDIYRRTLNAWFIRKPHGFIFTGESLRRVGRFVGMPEPHHPNAWGAMASSMLRQWMRDGEIKLTGKFRLAKSPATHAHAYREYQKL